MNLLLLEHADFIDSNRILLYADDPRARHIASVLDAQIGDSLRVGELHGNVGSGIIVQRNDTHIELSVTLNQSPPAKLPLTVLLALPRPKMMRRILRTVAEMGVQRLILLNTYKVEKSYWSSPAIAVETAQNYFREGLQQARDTILPQLEFAKLFKPFAEDKLPEIVSETTALVAHPGDYPACPVAMNKPCTLAIGPEGGFTGYEIKKLQEAGMKCVQMGPRILRVDTAVTSLIARLYC
ncbi:MAG: 16S rRNA (uracil(1498)-N(3))-methyltransferase [Spongiibacteraceae bacterium]